MNPIYIVQFPKIVCRSEENISDGGMNKIYVGLVGCVKIYVNFVRKFIRSFNTHRSRFLGGE